MAGKFKISRLENVNLFQIFDGEKEEFFSVSASDGNSNDGLSPDRIDSMGQMLRLEM